MGSKGSVDWDAIIPVGVDDGHARIKLVLPDGQTFVTASRGKQGRHLLSMDGGASVGLYSTDDGREYTVDQHLSDFEDTRTEEYPHSTLNRVLVHHGLHLAGLAGKEVAIATGLPVAYFYLPDGSKKADLIDAKRLSLSRTVFRGEEAVTVRRNVVTTEAIAAYIDQMVDMEGNDTPLSDELSQQTVGVIDIGGRTTDCAVVLPGSSIEVKRSGSFDIGVLALNDIVSAHLRNKFRLSHLMAKAVEAAITTGQFKYFGKAEDVSAIVSGEKERLAQEILTAVRAKIGSGGDLDRVLIVGGGSIVLREQLMEAFPHCLIPEQPEFANARGMLKALRYFSEERP
jgi:plasmid segregation protein ParM